MCFVIIVELNGILSAKLANDGISKEVLEMIYSWKKAGANNNDIIDRLRVQCLPPGYTPKPWNSSNILINMHLFYEYTFQICQYTKNGVPS